MKPLMAKVKFEKFGDKIKFTLPFKMYCTEGKHEVPHTMTLRKNDGVIVLWLGKDTDELFRRSKILIKKVNLSQVYDSCDVPGIRK